jgi:transcriptional regulator with XRE-family HTH domain
MVLIKLDNNLIIYDYNCTVFENISQAFEINVTKLHTNKVECVMKTIGERLKKIRTTKHLTQSEMGASIGVSKQAIANVESGHNKPSIEFISKLIENYNVNSNWLISEVGQMFNAPKYEEVEDVMESKVLEILKKQGVIK